MLTTQLLKLVIYKVTIKKYKRTASESNQKCSSVVSGMDILYTENTIITTVTYSSMVAAWIADQKDAGLSLPIF